MSSLILRSNLDAGIYVPKIITPDNWRMRFYGQDRGSKYPHLYSVDFVQKAVQDIKKNTPSIQVSYLEISALKKPIPVEQGLAVRKSISNAVLSMETTQSNAVTENKTNPIEMAKSHPSVKKEEEKSFLSLLFAFFDWFFGIND